jgi:hypothetical protein
LLIALPALLLSSSFFSTTLLLAMANAPGAAQVGENISLEARIVAAADIFDVLISHRPYKELWNNQDAFKPLQENIYG